MDVLQLKAGIRSGLPVHTVAIMCVVADRISMRTTRTRQADTSKSCTSLKFAKRNGRMMQHEDAPVASGRGISVAESYLNTELKEEAGRDHCAYVTKV